MAELGTRGGDSFESSRFNCPPINLRSKCRVFATVARNAAFRICLATLRSRNHGLSWLRVSALLRTGIYGRGYVIVGLAGNDCAVGVRGRSVERRVDHRIYTTRRGAAVYVVADCVS